MLITSLLLSVSTYAGQQQESTLIRRNVPTEFEMSDNIDDLKYYESDNRVNFYNEISIGNEMLTTYDLYPDCLTLDFNTSTSEGKLSLNATINNLIKKSGLDIRYILHFTENREKCRG